MENNSQQDKSGLNALQLDLDIIAKLDETQLQEITGGLGEGLDPATTCKANSCYTGTSCPNGGTC